MKDRADRLAQVAQSQPKPERLGRRRSDRTGLRTAAPGSVSPDLTDSFALRLKRHFNLVATSLRRLTTAQGFSAVATTTGISSSNAPSFGESADGLSHRIADGCESLWRLRPKQGGGADGPFRDHLEGLVRRRYPPDRWDLGDGHGPEARRRKAALTLSRIAEQEEVGSGRQGNIHAAVGLHGAVDHAEADAFRRPGAEGHMPLLRSTRKASRRRASGSGKCGIPKLLMTASTPPSGNGSTPASPSRNSVVG